MTLEEEKPAQTVLTQHNFRGELTNVGAQLSSAHHAVHFFVTARQERNSQEYYFAQPLTFIKETPSNSFELHDTPTFSIGFDNCQWLMDCLWTAGVRPSHSRHVSDLLAAKDAHIAHLWSIIQTQLRLEQQSK